MRSRVERKVAPIRQRLAVWLRRPQTLALVPAASLLAYFAGGEIWLVASVIALQSLWLIASGRARQRPEDAARVLCQPVPHASLEALLEDAAAAGGDLTPTALVLCLDEAALLRERHGDRLFAALEEALAERLGQCLRAQDAFCALSDGRFGVALAPQRGMALPAAQAVAQRLQADLAQPFHFEEISVWPTVSVGLCLSPAVARSAGLGMLAAAERAARVAAQAGPAALHSFTATDRARAGSDSLRAEVHRALTTGEICAYFQPQVALATGAIAGMETLARWQHPLRGLILPDEFVPLIEAEGLSQLLAERMLRDGLAALNRLDAQGLDVPNVAVNLSAPELGNPALADTIAWELDRHELAPERLVLEIVETVVTHGDDDVVVRNVARLASLGCGIDLDDFGTGHASIANIRRFAVGRIKIDRSFVTNMHRDPGQRRMVAAILSMAGELGLQCIAEGIESPGEATALAGMGCAYGQGFGIARPMPASDLARWLRDRATARAAPGTVLRVEAKGG